MIGKYKPVKHGHWWAVLALVLAAVASHIQWFNPLSILQFGDWQYRPDEHVRQLITAWQTWVPFENMGSANILMSSFPFRGIAWSSIANLGFSYDIATKVTLFWPVAIGSFLTSYLLVHRVFKDKFVAVVAALFYGTTPYFLILQTAHLPIAVIYTLTPLLVYWLDKALHENGTHHWLLLTLGFCVGIYYDVRIMYIVALILVLWAAVFVYTHRKVLVWRPYILPLIMCGVVLVLANIFWLIPTKIAAGGGLAEQTGQGLFGNDLFNLSRAFTIMRWSWTGSEIDRTFTPQPVPLYLWIAPIVAFVGLALSRRHRLYRAVPIVFLIIALVGIFLTKQSAAPLPAAYQWLFDNFPGFALFREASKFYLLVSFGFMGLIAYSLVLLKENAAIARASKKFWLTGFIVTTGAMLGLVGWNLKPATTEQLGGTFRNSTMPHDYVLLKKFIKDQPDYFRTYWLPRDSWWGFYDNRHPKIKASDVLGRDWAVFTDRSGGSRFDVAERNVAIFQQAFSKDLFSNTSVKYIVIPTRDAKSGDDFFPIYGDDRQYFIDSLDTVSFLKRVNLGTKELVIYENTAYRPYISTSTNLYAATNAVRPAEQANFIASLIGAQVSIDKKQTPADYARLGLGSITTLFDVSAQKPAQDARDTNLLSQTMTVPERSYLQAGQKPERLSYTVTGSRLTLQRDATGSLEYNGTVVDASTPKKTLGTATIDGDSRNYYLGAAGSIVPLEIGPGVHAAGLSNQNVHIYKASAANLITNPSFEDGPWSTTVEDCNNYDNNPGISMYLDERDVTEGKKRLNLYASRHTACMTKRDILVTGGQDYALNFDYKNEAGQKIGYILRFNGPNATSVRKEFDVFDKSWHHLSQSVTVPKGATTMDLTLLALPAIERGQSAATYFDNFRLNPLQTILSATAPTAADRKIALKTGLATFSYKDSSLSLKNNIPNGSFENGTWQQTVGDCHNYDANPHISMELTKGANAENRALLLKASRHIACTHQNNIPVRSSSTYFFGFDFKVVNTRLVRYRITFNDPSQTTLDRLVPVEKTRNWQQFVTSIEAPVGASSISLRIFAIPNSYGQQQVAVAYDDFSLVEIPALLNAYHVVSDSAATLKQPDELRYDIISPTKKAVVVRGATSPFYLTMNESYDPNWQLGLRDRSLNAPITSELPWSTSRMVPNDQHIAVNGSLNAWLIDPAKLCKDVEVSCRRSADGKYNLDLIVEYGPQRWFNAGLIISGTTFSLALGYILYDANRRRIARKHHHYVAPIHRR
jgi:hypothetical protein